MSIGIVGGKCSVCGKEYKPGKLPRREIDIVFGYHDPRSKKEPTLICIECHGKRKEKRKKEIQFTVR